MDPYVKIKRIRFSVIYFFSLLPFFFLYIRLSDSQYIILSVCLYLCFQLFVNQFASMDRSQGQFVTVLFFFHLLPVLFFCILFRQTKTWNKSIFLESNYRIYNDKIEVFAILNAYFQN